MFNRILPWILVAAAVIGCVFSHSIPLLHHKPEPIFLPHHNELKDVVGIELQRIPLHDGLEFGLEKHKHELMEHEREFAHGLLEKELLEKELKRKHEMLEHEHKELEHREHEILEHEKKELEHRQHELMEHERKELEHRQHDLLEHERKELEHREHELLDFERRELEHKEHELLDHLIPPHDLLEHHPPVPDLLEPHIPPPHDGLDHHVPPHDVFEHHIPPHNGLEHHVPPHNGIEHHVPPHGGLEHHTPHEHGIFEHEGPHEHQVIEHDIIEHELPPPWEDPSFIIGEEVHHHEEEAHHHDEEAHHHEEEEFHHDELFPVGSSGRRSNRRGGSSSRGSSSSSSNRGRSNNRSSSSNRNRSNSNRSSNRRSGSNNRSSSNNRNSSSSNRRSSSSSNRNSNRNSSSSRRNRNNINTSELFPRRNRQNSNRNNNNRRSNSNNSNRRSNNNNNRRSSNLQDLPSMEEEIFLEPEITLEIVSRPERQAEYGYTNSDESHITESAKTGSELDAKYTQGVTSVAVGSRPSGVATFRNTYEFTREETEGFADEVLANRTPILSGIPARGTGSYDEEYSSNKESRYSRNNQGNRRKNGGYGGGSSTGTNIFNQGNTGNVYVQEEEYLTLDNDPSRPSQSSSRPSNHHQGSRPGGQEENNGFYGPGQFPSGTGNKKPQNPQGSFFVNENRPGSHRPQQSFGSGFEEGSRPSHRPSTSSFSNENNAFQRPFGSVQGNHNSNRPFGSHQGSSSFQRPLGSSFSHQGGSISHRPSFENQETSSSQRPFGSNFNNEGDFQSPRPLGSSFHGQENSRPKRPDTQAFYKPQNPSGFVEESSGTNFGNGKTQYRPQRPTGFFEMSSGSNFGGSETQRRPLRPSSSSFGSEPSYRPQRPSHSSGVTEETGLSFVNSETQHRPSRPSGTNFNTELGHRPQRPSSTSGFVTSESSYARPHRPSSSNFGITEPSDTLYRPQESSKPYRPFISDSEGYSSNQQNIEKPYRPVEEDSQYAEERPEQYDQERGPQNQGQFNGGYSQDFRRESKRPVSSNEAQFANYKEEPSRPGTTVLEHLTSLEDETSDGITVEETLSGHKPNRTGHSAGYSSKPGPTKGNNSKRPNEAITLQEDSWLWPYDPNGGNSQVEPFLDQGNSNFGHGHRPTNSNHGHGNSQGHNHGNNHGSSGHGSSYNNQGSSQNNQGSTHNNKGSTTPVQTTTKRPANSGTKNFQKHPNLKLLPLDSCGIDLGNKIIGGTNTQLDEFPWMALLQHTSETGQSLGFGCGGSLISPRYVLTAAHCIKGPAIKNNVKVTKVRLGEFDTSSDIDCQGEICNQRPIDVAVQEIIVHPKYRATDRSQLHDIALIRLRENVKNTAYINTICLPWNGTPKNLTNERLTVAGWGKTANGQEGKSSKTKQKVTLPGVNLDDCSPFYNKINIQLQETQMCAGGEQGKDSCQGDSGGPLMMTQAVNSQVRWQVHGVVSFGPEKCGINNIAGVYTKVYEYLDWILDTIKQ